VESVLSDPAAESLGRKAGELQHVLIKPVTLDFSQPLTLDELSVIAVVANPDLAALRARQRLADAQVFASGLFPDPQLSASVDRVLSPTGTGLVSAYAGGLTLDVVAGLFTRSAERGAARHAAQQQRLDIAWAEWNTAGDARLLASRLQYQLRTARLADEAAVAARRLLASIVQASARGDLKGDDLQAQRAVGVDATLRAAAVHKDVESTRLELNRVLGLTPDTKLALAPPQPGATASGQSLGALFAAARSQRLDLRALEEGYAGQEAALHRAALGQYPHVAITLNRARDTTPVNTWGPAVNLDLPLWNRNRGGIALAAAGREVLRAEYAARLHQTRADIATLLAALGSDQLALDALRSEADAVAALSARYEAAAQRGDLARSAVDAVRLAAIDKQIAILGLEQSCDEQRIALALLTGDAFP
jgi:outer membrane protein TolC